MSSNPGRITLETPVPLLLEQLRSNPAWELMRIRLIKIRDDHHAQLHTKPPTTDSREIQRLIGFCEGINRVLLEPHRLETEWKRLKEKQDKLVERERANDDDELPSYRDL